MRILAHRGFWINENEKNTITAFIRAFEGGFGVETDIRDCLGEIVISHDPPCGTEIKLTELLDIYKQINNKAPLALNIKSDGLYALMPKLPETAFLFDASVPELNIYIKRGFKVYTRSSERERRPAFLEEVCGVWLDQFTDCSHIEDAAPAFIKSGKDICVVSPELHGMAYEGIWNELLMYKSKANFALCTDKPDEAKGFFA